jgi:hypothetical protein
VTPSRRQYGDSYQWTEDETHVASYAEASETARIDGCASHPQVRPAFAAQ